MTMDQVLQDLPLPTERHYLVNPSEIVRSRESELFKQTPRSSSAMSLADRVHILAESELPLLSIKKWVHTQLVCTEDGHT